MDNKVVAKELVKLAKQLISKTHFETLFYKNINADISDATHGRWDMVVKIKAASVFSDKELLSKLSFTINDFLYTDEEEKDVKFFKWPKNFDFKLQLFVEKEMQLGPDYFVHPEISGSKIERAIYEYYENYNLQRKNTTWSGNSVDVELPNKMEGLSFDESMKSSEEIKITLHFTLEDDN